MHLLWLGAGSMWSVLTVFTVLTGSTVLTVLTVHWCRLHVEGIDQWLCIDHGAGSMWSVLTTSGCVLTMVQVPCGVY
eukprot:5751135-Pyramimonas_sp.AAC.1